MNKPKSLQECKDDIARKYGFENWRHFYSDAIKDKYVLIDTYTDEAAKEYTIEVLHEVAKRWHTNKVHRWTSFKTVDDTIFEIINELK